jgi:hypothetical protein
MSTAARTSVAELCEYVLIKRENRDNSTNLVNAIGTKSKIYLATA